MSYMSIDLRDLNFFQLFMEKVRLTYADALEKGLAEARAAQFKRIIEECEVPDTPGTRVLMSRMLVLGMHLVNDGDHVSALNVIGAMNMFANPAADPEEKAVLDAMARDLGWTTDESEEDNEPDTDA